MKATPRPRLRDAQSLLTFQKEYPDRCERAILLHTGRQIAWLAGTVLAAPWWRVC